MSGLGVCVVSPKASLFLSAQNVNALRTASFSHIMPCHNYSRYFKIRCLSWWEDTLNVELLKCRLIHVLKLRRVNPKMEIIHLPSTDRCFPKSCQKFKRRNRNIQESCKLRTASNCALIKSAFCWVQEGVTVTNPLLVQKPSRGMKCKRLRANLLADVLFNELPSLGPSRRCHMLLYVNFPPAQTLPGRLWPRFEAQMHIFSAPVKSCNCCNRVRFQIDVGVQVCSE